MNFRQMIHEFSCHNIDAIVFHRHAHDKKIIRWYSLLIDHFKDQSMFAGYLPEFLACPLIRVSFPDQNYAPWFKIPDACLQE